MYDLPEFTPLCDEKLSKNLSDKLSREASNAPHACEQSAVRN